MMQFFLRSLKPSLAYNQIIGQASPGVVFLSGYNSNMNGQKALALEDWCKSNGRSFLRFDYSGTGSSEGKDASLYDWIEDASDIFSALTNGPQVIVGSSMGAFVMLHLHNRFPKQVNGLIGVSPAFNFVNNVRIWNSVSTYKDGVYICPTPEGNREISKAFFDLESLNRVDLFKEKRPIELHCPLHILHGMCDDTISWEHSLKFVQKQLKSSHEVRVTFRKDGDHRLSSPVDIEALLRELDFMISQISPEPPAPTSYSQL